LRPVKVVSAMASWCSLMADRSNKLPHALSCFESSVFSF
jgi:hypothetical protein